MRIAIASDHRGFEAKRKLIPMLKQKGHQVEDFGCDSPASCDYPDYAVPAGRSVAAGNHDVGIFLDGSGIGMSIAANKVKGIRAALVHDEVTARRSREHNHCNVLCLGTDLLSEAQINKIVEIFLETAFADGRHTRRLDKIRQLEQEGFLSPDYPGAPESPGAQPIQ
jgi:ribose 5-phosphate isomerase B